MEQRTVMNEEDMSYQKNKNEYAIQTFGITKKYGDRTAVNNINIRIKAGEMFSLLGPNGAGKTTTINMLCCLLKPTVGTATIMGHDIKKNPLAVKEIIDVSPQETAIAGHLDTWENLLLMGGVYGLSKQETKKRAKELIELIGLSGRTKEQVRKFSGGMQTMVIKAQKLSSAGIEGLKKIYPSVREIENGVEIELKELIFDDIVDYLRSKGAKIKWLSMKEPSLDDVFLRLTGEEVNK